MCTQCSILNFYSNDDSILNFYPSDDSILNFWRAKHPKTLQCAVDTSRVASIQTVHKDTKNHSFITTRRHIKAAVRTRIIIMWETRHFPTARYPLWCAHKQTNKHIIYIYIIRQVCNNGVCGCETRPKHTERILNERPTTWMGTCVTRYPLVLKLRGRANVLRTISKKNMIKTSREN